MKKIYVEELESYKKDYQKSFLTTFVLAIIIAIVCYTMSFSMADFFIKQTEVIAESIASNIAEISGKEISELSDIQTFLLIFWNNLKVGTVTILLGLILIYRLSTFFTVLQFSVIGVVFGGLSAMGYNVINAFIFSFLPHAIIELTAFVYCAAIGNLFNKNILTKVFFRKRISSEPIGKFLKQTLRSYIFIVIPLLAIAAFVEAFITSRLSAIFI